MNTSSSARFLLLLLLIGVGVVTSQTCQQGQVVINGVCAPSDVTVPASATTAYPGSRRVILQVAQTAGDPTSLDILITASVIDGFFLVFGDSYNNNDAALFKVATQADKSIIVTVVDSYYQTGLGYPALPVSDTSLGGTENIQILGYGVDNTVPASPTLLVKIRRKYDTTDKYDTVFTSATLQLNRVLFGSPKVNGDAFSLWYTGGFFFILNAATQPCGDNLIFNGSTCIANDLTAPAKQYIAKSHADDFLTINYETNQDGSITFLVTALTPGYFGIGWGSNLMSNMDMNIFNVNTDNPKSPIVIVDDSYALGPGSPIYDTQLGGTYDIQVLGYQVVAGKSVTVKFTRLMVDTDTKYDFQFGYNQEIPFAFAFSAGTSFSQTLVYHNYNVGWGTLVLQAADAVSCASQNLVFINNQCVANDISLKNLTEQKAFTANNIQDFLMVQFGIINDDTIQFLFTIQSVGWFGFGFALESPIPILTASPTPIVAPSSMSNTDIIIFDTITLNDGSLAIFIQDSFSLKNIVPNVDTSVGGTMDYNLLGYSVNTQTGVTQVKVSRKLNTGDKYDYQFVKNTQVGVLYAWMSGINNIQYHGNNFGEDVLNFYYLPTCTAGQIIINGVCSANDIAALPSSASNDFLNIQFQIVNQQVTFVIVVQNTGWFGLGFGTSMTNTDMIIVTSNVGVVSISDNYSLKHGSPATDVSQGGKDNLTLLGYQLTGTQLTVKFSRSLNTNDQFDQVLTPGNIIPLVWAWGASTSMSYHGDNKGQGQFPLTNGYIGSLDYTLPANCPDGQLIINSICQANDIAPLPSQASNDFLNVQFSVVNDSITFVIVVQNTGWFGLGFGTSMTNTDMIIVQSTNGIVTVTDTYSLKHGNPGTDVSQGGYDNLTLLGYEITATQLTVKFSRLLNTNDTFDYLLKTGYVLPVVWAWGTQTTISFHGDTNYASGQFPLMNGYKGTLTYTPPATCPDGQALINSICQNNDIAPLPSSASNDFLNVQFSTNTNTVTFEFVVQNIGWFGFGFGTTMTNTDMIIVQTSGGIVTISDNYSKKHGSPGTDVSLGGEDNLSLLGWQLTDTQLTVKFSRLLNTGDQYDAVLTPGSITPVVWAWGTSTTISYHGNTNYATGQFPLTNGYKGNLNYVPPSSCPTGQILIGNICVDSDLTPLTSSAQNTFLNLQFSIVDNSITFMIVVQNTGWFGLGFGTSMTNADMIIVETTGGVVTISDNFSFKHGPPGTDVSLGGYDNLTLLGYQVTATQLTVKFSRLLNTGDKYDAVLTPGDLLNVVWAWGTAQQTTMSYHDTNYSQGLFPLKEGYNGSINYNPSGACQPNEVSIGGQCQINNITPLTSFAQDSFLNVQFSIVNDLATFMLVVQNNGWFGIGFGTSMDNCDMVIISNSNGYVTITDSYSTSESAPGSDVSQGGEDNYNLLGYQATGSSLTVKFQRKLNTGDKYDYVLVAGETLNIVYAWGSSSGMQFHGSSYAMAQFPFQEGYQGTLTGLNDTPTYKNFHFWSNFVLWGFVVDIAFIIARFFKTGRFYKEIHGGIMGIIVAFTAFVEIWMALKKDILFNGQLSTRDQMTRVHAVMGFIFLIFFLIEAIGGSFLNYLLTFKNTGDAASLKIKAFHKYFGYFLYIIGKINVFLGVRMVENDAQQTACISGYIIFIVLRLIMEYLYRKQPKIFAKVLFLSNVDEDRDTLSSTHSLLSTKEGYSNLVDMINSNKTTEQIRASYPTQNYVIYKDNIYTIDKISHPGGKFIFNQVSGKDIGRYMLGAYGLESTNMPAHTHSLFAIQLLKQHQIGMLNQITILSENSSTQHNWNISKEKNISKTTSLFYLESLNRIKVNNHHKGMEWFGRHFTLSDQNNEKSTRIYTNCISFSPYNLDLQLKMQSNYRQLIQNPSSTVDNILPQATNVLPLVIKRYESSTGLSQFLHDQTSQSSQPLEIRVEGPQGRGLELSDKSTGLHLFISGGTGILPFYDFLVYFSKYLMYKALEKKHGEKVAKFYDIANDNFGKHVNPDFKVKVIAAFNAPDDDNNALELLEFMKQIDLENNLNLFEAVVSVKGYTAKNITVDNQYFTQKYFEKHIGNLIVQRAFVCGPPGINKNAPLALQELSLSFDQIMVV